MSEVLEIPHNELRRAGYVAMRELQAWHIVDLSENQSHPQLKASLKWAEKAMHRYKLPTFAVTYKFSNSGMLVVFLEYNISGAAIIGGSILRKVR